MKHRSDLFAATLAARRWIESSALLLSGLASTWPADAAPQTFASWSNETALTTAPKRLQLGVSSDSSFALNRRVELRASALGFWLYPRVVAKVRWHDGGLWQLSSEHELSYPTWFLNLVSREGTLGLLPETTDNPLAALTRHELLFSVRWHEAQWLTARAGANLSLAGGDSPTLLDFPFLYQRFAALNSSAVPRLSLVATGILVDELGYELTFRQFWILLSDDPNPRLEGTRGATEASLDLYYQFALDHRIGLGGLVARAEFPVGTRTHWLPWLDYQIRF